jgi:ubiquinone biosynthesis protein Coq4
MKSSNFSVDELSKYPEYSKGYIYNGADEFVVAQSMSKGRG